MGKIPVNVCFHRMVDKEDNDYMEFSVTDKSNNRVIFSINLSSDDFVDLVTRDCVSSDMKVSGIYELKKKKLKEPKK